MLNGVYLKKFDTDYGVFEIAMIQANDPHIELPIVFVIDMPLCFQGRLIPHISHEGYLCYVEQMEADWNPNNLCELFKAVDLQITATLDVAIKTIDNDEMGDGELENEFVSYWSASGELYSLDGLRRNTTYRTVLAKPAKSDQTRTDEFITLEITKEDQDLRDNLTLQSWLNQRNLELARPEKPAIKTHYISVNPSRLSGVNWPPQDLKEVFSWLQLVDLNARDHLVRCIANSKFKRNVVLLDIEAQDPVSLFLEINIKSIECQLSSRKTRRKRKQTPFRNLVGIVSNKGFCSKFARLSVTKADKASILSRNQRRDSELSSKRIALIGCGTIGGYLAELLVRNGAGLGTNCFHLYDRDELKPHNFSRHSLSVSDFGNNKAIALAKKIESSTHLAKNISGFDRNFPINEATLSKYDIVIDATGRPPVSKRLAFIVRQMSAKRPIIVHVFNDGNGRAAKVFVDTNLSCYGCMTVDKSVNQDNADMRFKDLDLSKEKRVSCGNTYTVYDAGVSQISAAIALEAILNTLDASMPWTYSEFILDPRFRTGKKKILKPQKQCAVCNEV